MHSRNNDTGINDCSTTLKWESVAIVFVDASMPWNLIDRRLETTDDIRCAFWRFFATNWWARFWQWWPNTIITTVDNLLLCGRLPFVTISAIDASNCARLSGLRTTNFNIVQIASGRCDRNTRDGLCTASWLAVRDFLFPSTLKAEIGRWPFDYVILKTLEIDYCARIDEFTRSQFVIWWESVFNPTVSRNLWNTAST